MPNIFHQTVEDILRAATPSQRLLWNQVFLRYGERVPVSQLVIIGSIGTSELATYSANKLYVAYELYFGHGAVTPQGSGGYAQLYDPSNASFMNVSNNATYWDATAAAYRVYYNSFGLDNIIFSRITAAGLSSVRFIGYRIAI